MNVTRRIYSRLKSTYKLGPFHSNTHLPYTAKYTHRDVAHIFNERPEKPDSVRLKFYKELRPEIVENNPHLKPNEILRLVQDKFRALPTTIVQRMENQYEDDMKTYLRDLSKWKASISPEENIALLKMQVAADKSKLEKLEGRMVRKQKREDAEHNRHLDDLAQKPQPPGGVFLDFFCKSKEKEANQGWREFINTCSREWQSMSEEDKRPYYIAHQERLADYERQIEEWRGITKNRRRHVKMKGRPTRPKNAWLLYVETAKNLPDLLDMPFRKKTTILAEKWRAMSKEERKPFEDKADEGKRVFWAEMDSWSKQMVSEGRLDLVPRILRHPGDRAIRPFILFQKTMRRRERESTAVHAKRCGAEWKIITDTSKARFHQIFSANEFQKALELWKAFLLDSEQKELFDKCI